MVDPEKRWSDYARKRFETLGRRYPNGRLVHCRPSAAELLEGRGHSDQKVIFDTEAAAQATALDMLNTFGIRLYSYECPRSSTGHRHLTTTKRGHTPDRKLRGGR